MLRIDRIQITKLFDEINYDIALNESEPVSIITAPNGRGKTTMLNILSYILDPSFENLKTFRGVPFESFTCILSNGKRIVLIKKTVDEKLKNELKPQNRSGRDFRRSFLINMGDYEYRVYSNKKSSQSLVFSAVFNEFYHGGAEFLASEDEDYPYLGRNSSGMLIKYLERKILALLESEGIDKPVNFIRANRIQPVTLPPQRARDYDEPVTESPLKLACENLSAIIKQATEAYSDAVSAAKDKLPRMFLDGKGGGLDCEQFLDGWKAYSQELARFQDIGLIAPTDDFTKGKDIESEYAEKGTFLSTYLEAFKGTTEPLMDTYYKLKLFKDILDERNVITHKKAYFSKDGISLRSGNREIQLETLSSGEKHDFIMFYNLIFNIGKGGLVLIDEPEISLHIEWQDSYLDHLLAICKMNDLQAIVATHSPNIVSSHYDCLVDKGESYE